MVQGLNHSTGMLVGYLPAEKILINADLYTPPAAGAQAPAANANMNALNQTIRLWGLDVAQHVPIHGAPGPHADFQRIVNRPAN
jgi:hypothetical protein